MSQHLDEAWNKFCYLVALSIGDQKLRMGEGFCYLDIPVLYLNSQKLSFTSCIVISTPAGGHFRWLLKL